MDKKKSSSKKSTKKKVKTTPGKKTKTLKKAEVKSTPEIKKDQLKSQEKILRNVLISIGAIFVFIAFIYFYSQYASTFDYKGIEFKAVKIGDMIFYETQTLLPSRDGSNSPFGFRLRTDPSDLEKIPFENVENLSLFKVNGYSYVNGSFYCEGNIAIAIPNIKRLFKKLGSQFNQYKNPSCYNGTGTPYTYFNFKYSDKTEIKQIGEYCYDVFVKGNNETCEILPATEKLMVEIFAKYNSILGNN